VLAERDVYAACREESQVRMVAERGHAAHTLLLHFRVEILIRQAAGKSKFHTLSKINEYLRNGYYVLTVKE
jgi:hypothetical protein